MFSGEESMRQQPAWFHTVLSRIADAVIVTDGECRITYVNSVAQALTRWSQDDAVGKPLATVLRLVDGLTSRPIEDPVARVLAWNANVCLADQTILLAKDGDEARRIDGSAAPLRDSEGTLIGAAIVFHDLDDRQPMESVNKDVTGRRRAETELRWSEARQAAILDSALDSIVTIDHEGKILEFNPAAERMFGYRREQVLHQSMGDLIVPPSLRAAHYRGIEHYLATGEGPVLGKRIEITAMRADGTEFPVELAIAVIHTHGRPVFTAYLRDLTERKRQEQRTTIHHAVTRALVESVSVKDAVLRILQAICEQLNWDFGDFLIIDHQNGALECLQLWHTPQLALTEFADITRRSTFTLGLGLAGRVLENLQPAWIPELDRDANFPRGPVAARAGLRAGFAFPIIIDGEISGVLEFFSREVRQRDVDLLEMFADLGSQIGQYIKRKQAEADRDIFFTVSVDMLCIAGFDGYFKRLNPAWVKTLGWSEQELLQQPFLDLVHPDDRANTAAEAAALSDQKTSTISFENRYRCKDGSYRWLSWSATSIAERQMIYATAKDITEQKKADEQLKAALEMAIAASRANGDFLANMSHEVRSPMTAILGYVDMLLDPLLSEPEIRSTVQAIHSNGTYLLQIINDILDLSKIEAGKLELDVLSCSPWLLVQEAVSSVRVRADEKNLRLEVLGVGRLPSTVLTDPARVRQILTNLLSNAVKFTDPGRQVVVRLSVQRSPAHLCFEVEDEGIGMSPEQLGRLFIPFEQADSTSTRKYGGTGLGLSISKRLSDALGGDIQVHSEPGQGSSFVFQLPLIETSETNWVDASQLDSAVSRDSPSEAGVPQQFLTGRVLLAEDNKDIERVLTHFLNRAGLRVEIAENGGLAVEKALSGGFDVVLMDMQMPVLDGYDATKALRQSGYQGPIIALTAHAMHGDLEKYASCGLSDYLTKPVSIKGLLATLAKYLPTARENATKDDAGVQSLFQEYARNLPQQVQAMREALECGDLSLLSSLAHQTRGAAGMYGLTTVGETAGLVEDAVRENQDLSLLRELIEELEATADLSRHQDGQSAS